MAGLEVALLFCQNAVSGITLTFVILRQFIDLVIKIIADDRLKPIFAGLYIHIQ